MKHTRKILGILISLIIVLSLIPATASAASYETDGYTLSATEYHCVNGHTGEVIAVRFLSVETDGNSVKGEISVSVSCETCIFNSQWRTPDKKVFTNDAGCHKPFHATNEIHGWNYQSGDDYILFTLTSNTIPNITHHEKVNPTCTQAGTQEYWQCNVCHKLFSDSECKNEIPQPVVMRRPR